MDRRRDRHLVGIAALTQTRGLSLADALTRFPVITCDVFDTALTRRLARPEDVALLVGIRAERAGLSRCAPETFRQARLHGEAVLRRAAEANGLDEVRLADIYAWMAERRLIDDPEQARLCERATELAVTEPVPAIWPALAALDPSRQRLIFLSDTTLSGPDLAWLLTRHGFVPDPQAITSADWQRNKASGRLFAAVLERLELRADEVVHIGDNPISDVARAQEHGITTVHLPRRHLPREPEATARLHPIVRTLHSARRVTPPDPASLFPYATALMIGFTLFVLQEARNRGISHIHFLSRDGHIPLAIARRLIARSREPITLSYLHVSRQATTLPDMAADPVRLASAIGESLLDRALAEALSPLGIDTETTATLCRGLGIDPALRLNGADGFAPLLRLLTEGGAPIDDRLRQIRTSAQSYLRQEGFDGNARRMIVDVGWRGSTQIALTRLAGLRPNDVVGCYLGLWGDALSPVLNLDNTASYLFGFDTPQPVADIVRDGYVLLELFLSAPHAPVSGYSARSGRIEPVFATEAEPSAGVRRAAMTDIEAGILAEVDRLDALLDGAWPTTVDAASAMHDLVGLLTRPTRAQFALFNAVPFIHGYDGGHLVPPVNPLPLQELLLRPKAALRRIGRSPWRAGAVRDALPWPVPDLGFADFDHRLRKILSLLRMG